MLGQLGFGRRGSDAVVVPGVRGQAAVAPVLEGVAVELVGAGLDRAADDGARHVAELRVVVVGLDADLGQGVRAGLVGQQVVDRLVHVDAVEHEVVLLLALAVHEGAAGPEVLGLGEAVGLRRDHAGQEQGELGEVAPVEGHALDGGARDHVAHDRVLGLEDGGDAGDLDLLRDAELHLDVDACGLPGLQPDGVGLEGPEALGARADLVGPDGEGRDRVQARVVASPGWWPPPRPWTGGCRPCWSRCP